MARLDGLDGTVICAPATSDVTETDELTRGGKPTLSGGGRMRSSSWVCFKRRAATTRCAKRSRDRINRTTPMMRFVYLRISKKRLDPENQNGNTEHGTQNLVFKRHWFCLLASVFGVIRLQADHRIKSYGRGPQLSELPRPSHRQR